MFSFGRSKRVANIVIDDYVIRMVENNGKDLSSIKTLAETAIPPGVIRNGKIADELAFFEFVKELVQEWGIKHRSVRFYVPHELIILREIDLPSHVPPNEVKQYITMEIGNTIHFPFANPVFDIYQVKEAEKKVTILAAPEEEMVKYTNIFSDASLKPIAIDAHALGVYRYFLQQNPTLSKLKEKVFFILEVNLLSANSSIFHHHHVEFLRFQPLNISREDWQITEESSLQATFKGEEAVLQGEVGDLINEIDRLMNFYRFSMHQGNQAITDIIVLGDFPQIEQIVEKLTQRFDIPTTLLNGKESNKDIPRSFIPAMGLALKGGN